METTISFGMTRFFFLCQCDAARFSYFRRAHLLNNFLRCLWRHFITAGGTCSLSGAALHPLFLIAPFLPSLTYMLLREVMF